MGVRGGAIMADSGCQIAMGNRRRKWHFLHAPNKPHVFYDRISRYLAPFTPILARITAKVHVSPSNRHGYLAAIKWVIMALFSRYWQHGINDPVYEAIMAITCHNDPFSAIINAITGHIDPA